MLYADHLAVKLFVSTPNDVIGFPLVLFHLISDYAYVKLRGTPQRPLFANYSTGGIFPVELAEYLALLTA